METEWEPGCSDLRSPDFSLLSRPHPPALLSPSSLHIGLVSQDWVDQYKEKFLLAGIGGDPSKRTGRGEVSFLDVLRALPRGLPNLL